MRQQSPRPMPLLELALEGLQQERTGCVRRLEVMLADNGARYEVDAYLRRIDHINAALIRLADTRIAT